MMKEKNWDLPDLLVNVLIVTRQVTGHQNVVPPRKAVTEKAVVVRATEETRNSLVNVTIVASRATLLKSVGKRTQRYVPRNGTESQKRVLRLLKETIGLSTYWRQLTFMKKVKQKTKNPDTQS